MGMSLLKKSGRKLRLSLRLWKGRRALRARLRRALARGGIVDPPVFKQRYGPPPSWYCEASGLEAVRGPSEARGSREFRDQVGRSSTGPLDSGGSS